MGMTGECIFCGEAIELAADGAWQGVDDGACGCTASVEQGGDGEHEPIDESRAQRLGLLDEFGAYTARTFEIIDGGGT